MPYLLPAGIGFREVGVPAPHPRRRARVQGFGTPLPPHHPGTPPSFLKWVPPCCLGHAGISTLVAELLRHIPDQQGTGRDAMLALQQLKVGGADEVLGALGSDITIARCNACNLWNHYEDIPSPRGRVCACCGCFPACGHTSHLQRGRFCGMAVWCLSRGGAGSRGGSSRVSTLSAALGSGQWESNQHQVGGSLARVGVG